MTDIEKAYILVTDSLKVAKVARTFQFPESTLRKLVMNPNGLYTTAWYRIKYLSLMHDWLNHNETIKPITYPQYEKAYQQLFKLNRK